MPTFGQHCKTGSVESKVIQSSRDLSSHTNHTQTTALAPEATADIRQCRTQYMSGPTELLYMFITCAMKCVIVPQRHMLLECIVLTGIAERVLFRHSEHKFVCKVSQLVTPDDVLTLVLHNFDTCKAELTRRYHEQYTLEYQDTCCFIRFGPKGSPPR